MSHDKIIRMANQIATFFETAADEGRAAADVADHINSFWAPDMRAAFHRLVELGAPDLSPLAHKAAPMVRPAPESPGSDPASTA